MGECAESQLSVHIMCDATLAFIEMADFREQRVHQILFQVRENCYRML